MAFQEVTSLDATTVIALGKTDKKTGKPYPKTIEGYYLGNRKVDGKLGESTLHVFQTQKGNVGVWGTTDLNKKLSSVPVGTMSKAEFTGMTPTPRGAMHTYKVMKDSDNTIEVSAASQYAQPDQEDADAVGYDNPHTSSKFSSVNDDDDLGQEDEDEEPVVVPKAQPSANERTARLQNLLKSKKAN